MRQDCSKSNFASNASTEGMSRNATRLLFTNTPHKRTSMTALTNHLKLSRLQDRTDAHDRM